MKIAQLPRADEWTDWFAWYPVTTEKNEIVWMETVQRIEVHCRQDNVYPSYWNIYIRK